MLQNMREVIRILKLLLVLIGFGKLNWVSKLFSFAFNLTYLFLSFQCPISNLESNIAFTGVHQTMTKMAALPVTVRT